jgi:hypothetical protein
MIEILSLLVLVWIYLGVILSCTLAYEDYLKSASKRNRLFFNFILFSNFGLVLVLVVSSLRSNFAFIVDNCFSLCNLRTCYLRVILQTET